MAAFIASYSGMIVGLMGLTIIGLLYVTKLVSDYEQSIESSDCIEGNDWTPWSDCTKPCGIGMKQSFRRGDIPAKGGGKTCSPDIKVQLCNTQSCTIDYTVGTWGGWGTCSEACGPGKQIRKTINDKPSSGEGKTAQDILAEFAAAGGHEGIPVNYDTVANHFYQERPCNLTPCPIDCQVIWDDRTYIHDPTVTYKNPKYNPSTVNPTMADGSPNLLYQPPTIPNTDSMQLIPNPLFDSMVDLQILNPHWNPSDPTTKYIPNPNRESEQINNPNYSPTANPTIPNPFYQPERISIPTDPWLGGTRPMSDGWSYCANPVSGDYVQCETGGKQSRTGTIAVQPEFGGSSCGSGPAFVINQNRITETHSCNQIGCPIDCKLGDWIPDVLPYSSSKPKYSCNVDSSAKDKLLSEQGWGECSVKGVDITKDTSAGVRSRTRAYIAAANGGDDCDEDMVTEEIECNNFRTPDIRDYLGTWQSISDYDHAGGNDSSDYTAFESFVIYYDKNLTLNSDKDNRTGFYNIYLNIDDKTNNFSNVTNLVMGLTDPENYKLQLYDNLWRMYDFTLESPDQLTIHMKNLITHDEYDRCFVKINNTSTFIPGIGIKNAWRYTSLLPDNILFNTVTGIPYDIDTTAPLPTPIDWVYQTTADHALDNQYDGSCMINYDTSAYSFYCPTRLDRIPFNFDLYLGKWKISNTNPIAYYNITKTSNGEYRMYYAPTQSAYYPLFENEKLPHLLNGIVQDNKNPNNHLYFTIHKPVDVNGISMARQTGFKLKSIDATKQTYKPEEIKPPSLTWVANVSYDVNGDMSFV